MSRLIYLKKAYNGIFIRFCYPLTLFVSIVSCSSQAIEVRSLTYELDVEITSDTIDEYYADYLLQRYGDSLMISFNNEGSMRFDYFGSGENGFEYGLFNITDNHYYGKWKNLDTIYHYNVSENILGLSEKLQLQKRTMNSVECEVLQFNGSEKTFEEYQVNQTYYFNRDTLKIDPEPYKDYNEFFFDDYLKETQCFYLKKITNYAEYRVTYTLIRNNTRNMVEKDRFELNERFPFKEI